MKKLILTLSILVIFSIKARAVGISDIDSMVRSVDAVYQDAISLRNFAGRIVQLRDDGFQIGVLGSTQTIALNNQQKQGLLAEYRNLINKLEADIQALPQ